ncbi:MAG: hypothetical protein H7Z14_06525 [Anaerolineae bacterium]|nr:hypothetical protein [Phycisphaerae bacterium]
MPARTFIIILLPACLISIGYFAGEYWKHRRRHRAQVRGFPVDSTRVD